MVPLSGYEARILMDGKALPEYHINTMKRKNTLAVTCWIPSKAGKTFAVRWTDHLGLRSGRGKVYVDGEHADSRLFDPEANTVASMGFDNNEGGYAEYRFGKIEFTGTRAGHMVLDDEHDYLLFDEAARVPPVYFIFFYRTKTQLISRGYIHTEKSVSSNRSMKGLLAVGSLSLRHVISVKGKARQYEDGDDEKDEDRKATDRIISALNPQIETFSL
ncbi:hypothetical protein DACRYDRAFT_13921 [Dacryopinax primogenitus]|uniref:DUF7918 domain-containing protein n=1 Tax=Dacryopinax primogenitus (strain DJM 731) TaxID=1858805 RepID=M5GG29_DACPD|nr:uncharacterized protein DACRYDRAFT_13921 [Dacryopinax primogenitus]EJU04768.1 hypothetical protein DACRYDRAFT_13921 [Dacryopinax primogenitus]